MDIQDCKKCECCNVILKDQFGTYLGCFKEPYKGKWVAEIEKCPKMVKKFL